MKSLKGIKPGDRVAWKANFTIGHAWHTGVVERTTPTQGLTTCGLRFRLSDGNPIGRSRLGRIWREEEVAEELADYFQVEARKDFGSLQYKAEQSLARVKRHLQFLNADQLSEISGSCQHLIDTINTVVEED